jgi:hypothetical protein
LCAVSTHSWWQFGSEHFHGNNIDHYDPQGTTQRIITVTDESSVLTVFEVSIGFISTECDGADTLTFQLEPIWIGPFELPTQILLEFFHVKNFVWLIWIQDSVG